MSKRRRRSRPPSSTWSAISSPSPSSSPPLEDDEWYAINEILDERKKHGRLEYLVDWEGIDPNTGKPYCQSWVSLPFCLGRRIPAYSHTCRYLPAKSPLTL